MTIPRLSILSATLLAVVVRAGCPAGFLAYGFLAHQGAALSVTPGHGDARTVVINHFQFEPDTVTIHVGETVEWKNIDMVPHTATAVDGKAFDSGPLAKGASWRFTFTRKRAYDYICRLHPNMKAKVIVE